MLDLIQYNTDNKILPSTRFSVGDFKEIPDFSSTTLFWKDEMWESRAFLIPTKYLHLVIERNVWIFAQKIFKLWISNFSEDLIYENINPITNGPIKVMAFIDFLFQGQYRNINFDLPEFMGGWWRYFQDEGYEALNILVGNQFKECRKDTHDKGVFSEDFLFNLHNGLLAQRFLEWDEWRYISKVLELSDIDKQNELEIYNKLKEYIKNIKNSTEKELLWRSLCSIKDVTSLFPVMGDRIKLDFLDKIRQAGSEKMFYAITSYSLEEILILEKEDFIEQWIQENLSEKISQKLKEIILSIYENTPKYIETTQLNTCELEDLCLAISSIRKDKKWGKWEICKNLFEKLISSAEIKEDILKVETLEYALKILPKRKKIEKILRLISIENFVILFDKIEWTEDKRYILKICKSQLKEAYARVTSGDTVPYSRIIHFIASGKNADVVDMFFGISWLLMSSKKEIAHKKNPLLPHKKPELVTSKIRSTVTDLIHSKTTIGIVQSKITRAVTAGSQYRESLLYNFSKDFYPIGAKIHFLKPITPEQVAILNQIVGFWSTAFKLLHADTSLCIPACQSPVQIIAILHRLMEMGIISDDTLELQLAMAGRVPNQMVGIIGSICLFSKIQPISYPRSTFVTSHNSQTGTCIMCYDAGILDTKSFPNLPPHISGRIDMLGFKNPIEVITYFLVSNLISQYVYGSPLWNIGKEFIYEYNLILKSYGITDILRKKWVHNPDKQNTPVEEEEHYKVVKTCTDILAKDIWDYNSRSDTSWLSFAVKNLLYKYIIKHKLLPLEEQWAKKYASYLKYELKQVVDGEI